MTHWIKLAGQANTHKFREMVTLKRSIKSPLASFVPHLHYVPQGLLRTNKS